MTFTHCLFISLTILILIALSGILFNRHNILIIILAFEFLYIPSNLIFSIYSNESGNILGLFYIIYNLTIVGAEACLGLALVALYYYLTKSVFLHDINSCKL